MNKGTGVQYETDNNINNNNSRYDLHSFRNDFNLPTYY